MSDLKGLDALVVDDDPGIRIAVSLKLRSAGINVNEATDGLEALEYLQENRADFMVVDVGMPRMDGYTLCQKLQENLLTRDMPVIILTAQDMEVPADVLARIGRHRFLMKPFSPRELIKVATELMEKEEA